MAESAAGLAQVKGANMTVLTVPDRSIRQVPRARLDVLPLALTASRVPLVSALTYLVATGQRTGIAIALLVLFVVVDIGDGLIARRSAGGDTAQRRGLDSVIDRAGTAAVMLAAVDTSPYIAALGCALLVLSVSALGPASRTYAEREIVLKAPGWHRAWSAMLALAGLCLLAGSLTLATALATIGVTLAAVCTQQLRKRHLELRVRS